MLARLGTRAIYESRTRSFTPCLMKAKKSRSFQISQSAALIHREPAIELCGADPYKFAELRELGLINSQIDWKQRFFVPTDEERGIDILSALLDRYPVVVDEEAASTADSDELDQRQSLTLTSGS